MAALPKIGDKKTFVPHALTEGGIPKDARQVTGTVTYVHPAGRFYLVEADICGVKIREAIFPGE